MKVSLLTRLPITLRLFRWATAVCIAALLSGCAGLLATAASTEVLQPMVPDSFAVAEAEVALALADVASDEGVVAVHEARRLARHAAEVAVTPEQRARGELLSANVELRTLSDQLSNGARQPTAVASTVTTAGADSVARAPQRRAVVSVAPPRELVSADQAPTPTATAEREVVLVRAETPHEVVLDANADTDVEIWQVPVRNPRVTSQFGPRIDPITGERGRMHRGTDYGHPTGTPVYAPASGRAILAGYCDRGTGNCIVLEHTNGWRSQYFHLSRVNIRAGQEIVQGQQIGEIGSTGRSTGPHLHFQIGPPGGGAVDPELILGTPVQ